MLPTRNNTEQENQETLAEKVAKMLERHDLQHRDCITPASLVQIMRTWSEQEGASHWYKSNIEKIIIKLSANQMDVGKALTIYANDLDSCAHEHSEKTTREFFIILSTVFKLDEMDFRNMKLFIDCFYKETRQLTKTRRNHALIEVVDRTKQMTPTEIVDAYKESLDISKVITKKVEAAFSLIKYYGIESFFRSKLNILNVSKSAGLRISTAADNLKEGTLTGLEAIHVILTADDNTANAFKYILILKLAGVLFDNDEAKFIVPSNSLGQYLLLIENLTSDISNEYQTHPFLTDLIPHFKAAIEAEKDLWVKKCLGRFDNATDFKSQLRIALVEARQEKDKTLQDAGKTWAGMFTNLALLPKTMIRDNLLNEKTKKLDTETPLQILLDILSSNVGKETPHSFKYTFLQQVFKGQFKPQVSEAESSEIINRFIRVIKEMQIDRTVEFEDKATSSSNPSRQNL